MNLHLRLTFLLLVLGTQSVVGQSTRPDSMSVNNCLEECKLLYCVGPSPTPVIGKDSLGKLLRDTPYFFDAPGDLPEGRVYIRFEVDEYGTAHSFDIVRSLHPLLDSTALNVAQSLEWYSGWTLCWGKRRATKMGLPFAFRAR